MSPPLGRRYRLQVGGMLRLTTFGGVSLRPAGGNSGAEEKSLPRRGLAVLVLLAAGPASGVSRDTVVAYLWPESAEDRARGALRQTIFALRRDLSRPDLLLGGPDLTLNPAALISDVRELHIARAAGDLERVVELYAGPFLDGFHLAGVPEFERWVDRQRTEYAAWATSALESLARGAGKRGDHTAAAEWWRRLVAADPLNTRVVMESMLAQGASGNAAGALRQAQEHEELLSRELGASPDRALGELVARIRRGEPLSAPQSIQRGGPPLSSEPAAPAPRPTGSERFQDRLARELADRYVLEDEGETGGEGGVRLYRARDRRHDRRVTLKVVHPALASQIDVERFVREIRLTGKLLHPHILPLLDSGEVGGRPWFAIPLPEGETLRARLTRESAIAPTEAVRLALELADALGYAHRHGVVHRDVSPENVILAGGHALLINLGVARALDTAAEAALTDSGTLIGSAAYMSPEQAKGARTVDGRSDLYALGAVLFEMLAGEPLFSGPTPQAIMARRMAEQTPDLSRLGAASSGLRTVLKRTLASDRDRRYASMTELSTALCEAVSAERGRHRLWRVLVGWIRRTLS